MENLVKFEAYLEEKSEKACDLIDKFVLVKLAEMSLQSQLTAEELDAIYKDSIRACRLIFLADSKNLREVCGVSGEFGELSLSLVLRLEHKYYRQMTIYGEHKWAVVVNTLRENGGNFDRKAVVEMICEGE